MSRTLLCVYVIFGLMGSGYLPLEASARPEANCSRVKYSLEKKGFVSSDLLLEGRKVGVCGSDHCCPASVQEQLLGRGRQEFTNSLNHTLHNYTQLLHSRAVKFDNFFRDMLENSKKDFHQMFLKTYGIMYEKNAYLFTDFFRELEKYYANGQADLTDTVDEFFSLLYQKMFVVLNAGYQFTDKYLQCVNDLMKELKPFGDVPGKLSTLLKRSFVATRTFSQSLHVAARVFKNMQNVSIADQCYEAYTKMTQCQVCTGHSELKPCPNYCTNVMKGCLARHSMLESHWNTFIDLTDKVVDRLLGPFNIEMVVEPINIKISEAIMNFQESSQEVSNKVFADCGKPQLGRSKRENGELELESLDFPNQWEAENGRGRGEEAGRLARVIMETRKMLSSTRNFWHKMPYHMCGDTVTGPDESCWNGKDKDKYLLDVVGDGLSNQERNPEVAVDVTLPNSLVNEQIFALKTFHNKLKAAYEGVDYERFDNEDPFVDGSGSGSGDWSAGEPPELGSGDLPTPVVVRGGSDVLHGPTTLSPPHPHPQPGSGIEGNVPPPLVPATDNNEPNEIPKIPDLRFTNNTRISQSSTASSAAINRVVFSFIVPIVMVSFGKSLIDFVIS